MDVQSSILSVAHFNVGIFVLMLILVLFSAFFSMSETAFSSVSETRLRMAIENKVIGAKKALYLYERFDKTITTLLIGNNLVNVLLSTIAVIFFTDLAIKQEFISLVTTLVITITLLIFGEIVPKMIAKKHSESICTKVAIIVLMVVVLLMKKV